MNPWLRIASRLAARIGEGRLNAAVPYLTLVRLDGDEAVFAAPSSYHADKLRRLLEPHLTESVREVTNRKTCVVFTIDRLPADPPEPARPPAEDFLAAPCNRFAWETALHAVQSERPLYRLVYVCGPSGSGKSHLLECLDRRARPRFGPNRVVRIAGQDFSRRFVLALRSGAVEAFRRRVRAASLLLFDEVDALCGKDKSQEEFLYALAAVLEGGGRAVLTGQPRAHALHGLHAPLRHRIRDAMEAALRPPDEELRRYVLAGRGPASALDLLAAESPANLKDLLACRDEMERRGLGTPDGVRTILAEWRRRWAARPEFEEIVRLAAREFGVTAAEVLSPRRSRDIARARAVAVWLARTILDLPFERIGAQLGGKSHSAAIQAFQRVERRRPAAVAQAAERIAARLRDPLAPAPDRDDAAARRDGHVGVMAGRERPLPKPQ